MSSSSRPHGTCDSVPDHARDRTVLQVGFHMQQLGTVTFLTNSYKGSELQTTLFTQA